MDLPQNKVMNKHLCLILALALAAGCAMLPGHTTTTTAMLDGERQVHVSPGWLRPDGFRGPTVKLGGFWGEQSPNEFALEAVVVGSDNIEGVKIGIDGQVFDLRPIEGFADYRYDSVAKHHESAKRFIVPLLFVEQMMVGRKVIVRVLLSGGYSEGEFSYDQVTYARPAFKKAFAQIRGQND